MEEKKNVSKAVDCVEDENFDITEVYTTLSEAKKEIERRWNDKDLRKKVEEFLGGDIPDVFKNEPRAVLARCVATPNIEWKYFLDLVDMIKMSPLLFEYLDDKFTVKNQGKYYLGKLVFCKSEEKKIKKTRVVDLINFNNAEGKKISKIKTVNNVSMVDFHHDFFCDEYPSLMSSVVDASKWVSRIGGSSENFYVKFLALFISNGILFENFVLNKENSERQFTNKVVIPAIKKLDEIFGVKPLIVPLSPIRNEAERYWWYYSSEHPK